ncbi:MAG: Rho termination factor N-terminal domain-containing protein [Acetobacteraceae bacterium]|nr:Rho termination factor N-terminal domain-containing protein [Acetobacteraceae bacterium]
MTATAERRDPKLWEKVKEKVTREAKGGRPGQWSARKAQLAVHDYKEAGGTYVGQKSADNHLSQWTRQEWGTKSGRRSTETGERYLPKKTREALSDDEYRRTTVKKRADTRKGRQFSRQPPDVADKAAHDRLESLSTAELRRKAATHGVRGRSRMRKAELVEALHPHA